MTAIGPLLLLPIRPQVPAEQERLARTLAKLAAKDPVLHIGETDADGWTLIGGESERDLDARIKTLRTIHALTVELGAPRVAYLETVSRVVTHEYTLLKSTAAGRAYARVKLLVEPGATGSGFIFLNGMAASDFPPEFAVGVEQGIPAALAKGPLLGGPVTDLKIALIDVLYNKDDSTPAAFAAAAEACARAAIATADPVLLEPIMKVDVASPEEFIGPVIAGLNSRRGQILGTETLGDTFLIFAMVPLANLFDYEGALRSLSGGRASVALAFAHYAIRPPMPDDDDPRFRPAMAMRA